MGVVIFFFFSLKWKPPHLNSIDFLLRLGFNHVVVQDGKLNHEYPDYDALPHFMLWIWLGKDRNRYFNEMQVNEAQWQWFKNLNEPLQNRVVECVLNEEQKWTFLRFRDDKTNANHISTFERVEDSIMDAVSADELRKSALKRKKEILARDPNEHMIKKPRHI